ncbi:hypothetical protein ACKVEX_04900 [Rhodocyclaceae bacterium SMB388]
MRQTWFFAICLASVCATLVVLGAGRQIAHSAKLLHEQAMSIGQSIATLSAQEVAANDRIALARRLEAFNDFASVSAIVVSDRRDEPLAAVRRNLAGNLSAAAVRDVSTIATVPELGASVWPRLSAETTSVRVPVGEIAPIGWVRLEYSLASILPGHMLLEGLLAGLLLTTVATVLFAALGRNGSSTEQAGLTVPHTHAATSLTPSTSESHKPSARA